MTKRHEAKPPEVDTLSPKPITVKSRLSPDDVALSEEQVRANTDDARPAPKRMILDVYLTDPPTREMPFKLFEGAWSSNIPGYGFGNAALFDDPRI